MTKNLSVYIDGVKYVPVQEVLVDVEFFTKKLIESWAGRIDGYSEEKIKDMMSYLKIIITDDSRSGGPTIREFINDMVK